MEIRVHIDPRKIVLIISITRKFKDIIQRQHVKIELIIPKHNPRVNTVHQQSTMLVNPAIVPHMVKIIEHIINTNTFIENCKKMLKPSGRIIFITPNGKCPWYGKLRRLFRSGKHCSTDRYYTKDQLDSVMCRHGFILQDFLYWGYYPAGVGNLLYNVLNVVGKILDKTRIQQYAGGLTISYVLKRESLDEYS